MHARQLPGKYLHTARTVDKQHQLQPAAGQLTKQRNRAALGQAPGELGRHQFIALVTRQAMSLEQGKMLMDIVHCRPLLH
ncbi:hypothetical protein D3C78_1471830 [compost metagenome]